MLPHRSGAAAFLTVFSAGDFSAVPVKKKYLTPHAFSCKITQVMRMDELLRQTLLYDFYGELLTDHQKEIYGQFILENLSLGEIAEEAGISRQGVHDLVKRCGRILEGYEEKLHLVEKFLLIRKKVRRIDELVEAVPGGADIPEVQEIRKMAGGIIEEL